MKVAVKDLKPNPFRQISSYPIDEEKVGRLVESIRETTFWNNLVARKEGGEIQIAYGHHRLAALKKARVREIDIEVRKLSDADMLKIMARENMEEWTTSVSVVHETVRAAEGYLRSTEPDRAVSTVDKDAAWVASFIGWPRQRVANAMYALRDSSVSEDALRELPSPRHADAFRKAVGDAGKGGTKIGKAEQKKIAKQIAKKGTGYRDVRSQVPDLSESTQKAAAKERKRAKREKEAEFKRLRTDVDHYAKKVAEKLWATIKELKPLMPKESDQVAVAGMITNKSFWNGLSEVATMSAALVRASKKRQGATDVTPPARIVKLVGGKGA